MIRRVQNKEDQETGAECTMVHPSDDSEWTDGAEMGTSFCVSTTMPICHDAKLFPCLFSSNRSLDVPYLPLEADLAPKGENRSFNLEGTLCFYIVHNISEASSCIPLYTQTAVWFNLPPDSGGPCHSANATWVSGWWPAKMNNSTPPCQPKWGPYCWGINWEEIWPWSGCQSHTVTWVDKRWFFLFPQD